MDVAERVGTSSPTILYWFESKDRLLEEAVAYADAQFYDRLAEGQEALSSPAARLSFLIEETALGPGGLNDYTLWMEIWVRARRDPKVRQSYFGLDRRQRALIAEIVRDGQRAGEFSREVDPEEFALVVSGLLDGLGVQVTLGQPDLMPETMVDCCLALASRELGCPLPRRRPVDTPGASR